MILHANEVGLDSHQARLAQPSSMWASRHGWASYATPRGCPWRLVIVLPPGLRLARTGGDDGLEGDLSNLGVWYFGWLVIGS